MGLFLKNSYSYTVASKKEEVDAYESVNKIADALRDDGKEVHIAVDTLVEDEHTTLLISVFEGTNNEEQVHLGLTF
tara:strand:+ start:93 stop:320 length:228 start_codon:yes stop_codon:yes gene_type:complete